MINNYITCAFKLTACLGAISLLASCSTVSFYTQSAIGHSRLMLARQAIDKAIERADEPIKAQLILSKKLKEFAISELGLPESGSYASYVPLKREYPVWTVVAAPQYSLDAQQWCYPVIGCASYRGYFKESAAHAYALTLSSKGLETHVSGAPAYSTLGWFDDPLLPSMMRHGEASFAETLFHEIAHQKLYVNGDSDFNEAFATVVGEVGAQRWLQINKPDALESYLNSLRVQQQFYELIAETKRGLQKIYSSDLSESQMGLAKTAELALLKSKYEQLVAGHWEGQTWYQSWFNELPNNAKFAALSTYRKRVPELEALLISCEQNLRRFYKVLSSVETVNNRVAVPSSCE